MISLRQVKSLLAVVETGSVNRASELLCLAPSSVSAQLRELSGSLGVDLFEQQGRGIVLSATGRELMPKFQHLLSLNDEIVTQAQTLVSEPAGELRLYAPSSMCIYRLPALIEALQSSAPAIELHLQHDPFNYQQALDDRSIDAAVVVSEKTEPGYEKLAIASEEVIYVTHPDLVVKRRLAPKQLVERALITTEAGCSYRVAAEQHFKQHNLNLLPKQSFSNVEVIRRCLLAKMGIGILPRCVVSEDIAEGRLQEQKVQGTPYRFKSTVIWPAGVEKSARLDAFLQVVRSHKFN